MTEFSQAELKFFVYVVESPSAPDLYHGRSEGTLVAQAAALDFGEQGFGHARGISAKDAVHQRATGNGWRDRPGSAAVGSGSADGSICSAQASDARASS